MNQASSRTRTRPSRPPSRRSRKRALPSLPRWVPRRTRRSISSTAPTRQPCSTTAARHSQPWPRRNRGRFGSALRSRWNGDPGAPAEIRPATVSSTTTCRTGGGYTRRPGRDPLAQGVVDEAVRDGGGEQPFQRPEQRPPDRQPGPAAAFQQPVVGGPGARQPDREDGVGDVAAAGDGGPDQQLGEGGAGPAGHRRGEAAGEGGRDGNGGRGHRAEPAGGGGRACAPTSF